MDIFLPPDLENRVKTKVENGLHPSASEVRLEALRRDIQKGMDSGAGAPLDMEAIKARGRAGL